jgi:5-methylcytosine-specific restriction protein A
MTRHNFSKSTMAARFLQCGGRCEGTKPTGRRCNVVLVPGRYHCDHHNPDGLGGTATLENCRCLCLDCHAAKTWVDVAYIAEAKQRQATHVGVPWPKPGIRSRGFPKSDKPKREPRQPLERRPLYR